MSLNHKQEIIMSKATNSAPINTEGPLTKHSSGFGKVKLAFLYVLIGGLAASALIAIIALLIGEFNSAIQKALLTIFIFFSHALFILALVWSDRNNTIGKALLPTTIGALAFANMITTTLGTWELITNGLAWRFFGFYFLVLGIVFIIVGTLKLRISYSLVKNTLLTTVGLLVVSAVALAPWVLDLFSPLDPFYFRAIGALAILTTTLFLIALIIRGITVAKHPNLKAPTGSQTPPTAGMLSIIIVLGVITALVWCAGFTGFLVIAVQSANPPRHNSYGNYYTLN